jgi:DNA-binding FadR family transcriptional regulator
MFKEAKQNRAFEDVVFQVQEAVLGGTLKAGDRLPSERQLREVFGVSRGTLREALRALEQKGLVYIKTGVGGGAFICEMDTQQVTESLDLLLRYQKINLKELIEFREAVEGLVAAKAAKRVRKADIDQLSIFLESMKSHLDSGELRWDEIIKEDNNFHFTLARIAGNRIFESVLRTVYENINRYFERFLPREREVLERTYRSLCEVREALEARDSERTQALVLKHIMRFDRLMEEGTRRGNGSRDGLGLGEIADGRGVEGKGRGV